MAQLLSASWSWPVLLQAGERALEELRWLSGLPAWVYLLIVLPLTVFFVRFIYRREKLTGGRAARWSLTSLRVTLLLAVIFMLGEPVLRTTKFLKQDSVVIVLVDDSLSMDISDKYSDRTLVGKLAEFFESSDDTIETTSRYDLIRRLFRHEDLRFFDRLREKGKVVVFSFAGGVQRLKDYERRESGDPELSEDEVEVLADYDELRADRRVQQTRISDALLDAVASVRAGRFGSGGEQIAGIVLVSDGQETGGDRAVTDVARRLGQRSIPVFAVAVGNPDDPKDIRAIHLEANDVVLAGDKVPFDVAIVSDGYEGERIRVDLEFDGRAADTTTVLLEGRGQRQTVRLEYQPPEPGDFVATVKVEPRGGELFTGNNSISKSIRVLDQKIRVLYADGPPRWEYRYLKNALIRDPTMEVQVFLFSADPQFIQESSPGMPPLTAFPSTREEIFAYHVIVLGDVGVDGTSGGRYLQVEQMKLLKEFVYEAGGGVVFVAGAHASPNRYRDTDLYSLLPVEVPERGRFAWAQSQAPVTEPFNVKLTPAGREHSVMRLENDYERNLELWENPRGLPFENLPGFYWFAEVGSTKKGAVALARHPDRTTSALDRKGLVIFAFMNYGKGRTFFSAVDNTWRWRSGVDNRYFYRFWGQVIRFVATGRLLGKTPRFSIGTDKAEYTLGESVNIESRVFDANMKPVSDSYVTVYHSVPGGDTKGPREIELALDPVRGQGVYHGTVPADRLGMHELWLGTVTEKLAFSTFEVRIPALEFRDPRRKNSLLRELASVTKGGFYELHEVRDVLEKVQGQTQSQRGTFQDDPLWNDTWVLLAFTGLIALEWILRKAARLL